ncbi:hypothetical protein [Enterovirga rhinocerotis]|uniref:Uncharacterized protein n=1 Tax=Enterovirga rhinocerotis TaxID=1339210 RepID=A0A4R7C8L9_9HYPH|nr:hypothetical protein [Enterovirga rhinocerotis]TDR94322.1 hypothetical protein EV668_1607 [Enterovirga rhinocerotis]
MSRAVRIAAALVLTAAGLGAARAEPSVTVVPLGFEVEQFRGPSSRVGATAASIAAFEGDRAALKGPVVVVWGREGGAALTLDGASIKVVRARKGLGDLPALERGHNALPDSRVGGVGALSAQFEVPLRDYAHEALGSAVHAGVLAVTERKPSPPTSEPKPVGRDVVRIPAGEGAVFEDREPHLVTLGGQPAILAVRSYQGKGSALALVAKREGAWRLVAETPADGEPYRWLNPVAGGAARDVALVRRPHLDGLLQLWRLEGDTLVLRAEKAGYSNHVYGGPAQDLAAWIPGPDGKPRLVVPTLDRAALAILAVEPELKEVARIPLPAKAKSGLAVLGEGRDLHVVVGLEDGRVADIRP